MRMTFMTISAARFIAVFCIMCLSLGLTSNLYASENDPSAKSDKISPLDILDILDRLSYAQALDKRCTFLDKDDQAKLYLSDRWAKSITYRDNYPPQILLAATQKKAAHLRATETLACDQSDMPALFDQMRDYIRETVLQVRLKDIQ